MAATRSAWPYQSNTFTPNACSTAARTSGAKVSDDVITPRRARPRYCLPAAFSQAASAAIDDG